MADTLRDEEFEFITDEAEVVDGLPVLVEVRELDTPTAPSTLAVAQTAAVAVGSFVAGAATAAVVAHQLGKTLGRTRAASSRRNRRPEVLEVVSSRHFLLDVHMLGRRVD